MEDRFNEGMSCITHFLFSHVILRGSFGRHQIMYNASDDIHCAEITRIGFFLLQ